MKRNLTLTITSLLSIILFSFHWADDIVRGFAPGGVTGLGGIAILVTWLCGTLLLSHRKLGYIIDIIVSSPEYLSSSWS